MPASDLPPCTTQLGVFPFNVVAAYCKYILIVIIDIYIYIYITTQSSQFLLFLFSPLK